MLCLVGFHLHSSKVNFPGNWLGVTRWLPRPVLEHLICPLGRWPGGACVRGTFTRGCRVHWPHRPGDAQPGGSPGAAQCGFRSPVRLVSEHDIGVTPAMLSEQPEAPRNTLKSTESQGTPALRRLSEQITGRPGAMMRQCKGRPSPPFPHGDLDRALSAELLLSPDSRSRLFVLSFHAS